MNQIGINFYNQILKKAIDKINKGEEKSIFDIDKKRSKVQTEIPYYFPENYINDEKIRLQFYRRLNSIEKADEFQKIRNEMIDRFGKLPQVAENVLRYYEASFWGEQANISSIYIRRNKITLNFKQNISRQKIKTILKEIKFKIDFKQIGEFQINIHIPSSKVNKFSNNFYVCLRVLKIIFSKK